MSRFVVASLDAEGFWPLAKQIDSPNQDERPSGTLIDLVVVHSISLPPGVFGGPQVQQLFTNCLHPDEHPYFAQLAHLKVSAHFFINRNGAVTQFVSTYRRAWHAGVSCLKTVESSRERCNDFSIGIELEGTDSSTFSDLQYEAIASLAQVLHRAHPIAYWRAHSEIAPGRKTDPGPYFDWDRLLREAQIPGQMRP
ncbi:MAG: 1,6-anhydro-N-acetylmuramyl-L-alanine amidase AmpD [Burkholderiaceae bacterium]|nr:1,6-anhydro-N-acetylmuramyl-L-alanine amidase AmpD [Burkholderiaceae bacterium]